MASTASSTMKVSRKKTILVQKCVPFLAEPSLETAFSVNAIINWVIYWDLKYITESDLAFVQFLPRKISMFFRNCAKAKIILNIPRIFYSHRSKSVYCQWLQHTFSLLLLGVTPPATELQLPLVRSIWALQQQYYASDRNCRRLFYCLESQTVIIWIKNLSKTHIS